MARFSSMKPAKTRGPLPLRTDDELLEQSRQLMRDRGWDLSAEAIFMAENLISDALPLSPQQADDLADLLRVMTTSDAGDRAGRHRHDP